ncbi:sigma-70 family RNA polymerase sigma factor [Pannonibacter phragmitetus]|uniref:sigma-70 family RNA polymerase sigma factor n=1 Tax=Pannonibacter phragmitetus TaxID=121719 RepID=UPI003D2ED2C4
MDPRLHPGLYPAQLVHRARGNILDAEVALLQPAPSAREDQRRTAGHQRKRDAPADRRNHRREDRGRGHDECPPLRSGHLTQRPLSDTEGSSADRQDFLVSDAPLPDEVVGGEIDGERQRNWLRAAMNVLTERERQILRERRLKEDSATLEAIGQTMGISKERVRQIENRALEKLKAALLKAQPDRLALMP